MGMGYIRFIRSVRIEIDFKHFLYLYVEHNLEFFLIYFCFINITLTLTLTLTLTTARLTIYRLAFINIFM